MEQIAINILPKGAKPVCHSSQFDEGRQIMFNLFNDDTPYTLSGTETISVLVRKPDGAEVVDSVVNTSDSYVIWDVSADACELSGVCECELSIVKNGILLGSKNFTMKVEEDAYNGKTIEVRTASGRIATFSTNMVEAFKSLKSKINPVQDLHGYSKPWSGGGGKNLLNNPDKTTTGGSYVINNVNVPMVTGNYMLSFDFSGTSNSSSLRIDDENGTAIFTTSKNITSGHNEFLINLPSNASFVKLFSNAIGTYTKFQIERGNQFTSYEPYENICPISGFSSLKVTRTGKNLLDFNPVTVTAQSRIVDNFTLKAGNYVASFHIKNTTAILGYFQIRIGSTSLGGTNFGANADGDFSKSFTLTEDSTINILVGGVSSGYSYQFSNGQIELGNQATDYEPYNGQTATVNFGQTVYGGVADVTGGKVNKTRNIVDLSTLNWVYASGSKRWEAQKTDMKNYPSRNADIIFEKYETDITATAGSEGKGFISGLVIYVTSNDSTTRPSGNACYPLTTPIEISTTPENLTAISGQTNNVYGDTNGDTTVEYYIEV